MSRYLDSCLEKPNFLREYPYKHAIFYLDNQWKELILLVNGFIAKKFSGLPQMEFDEMYSIAAEVVMIGEIEYDENRGIPFHAYIVTRIYNKLYQRITFLNREKRKMRDEYGQFLHEVSLDSLVSDDGEDTVKDMIPSDYNLEEFIFSQNEDFGYNENVIQYIKSLSKVQKEMVKLIMAGFEPGEVKKILNLTEKQYSSEISDMKRFDKICYLWRND